MGDREEEEKAHSEEKEDGNPKQEDREPHRHLDPPQRASARPAALDERDARLDLEPERDDEHDERQGAGEVARTAAALEGERGAQALQLLEEQVGVRACETSEGVSEEGEGR